MAAKEKDAQSIYNLFPNLAEHDALHGVLTNKTRPVHRLRNKPWGNIILCCEIIEIG